MPIQPCRNATKLALLLPFCVHGWWCETSAQTGCRGHSRHFVREVSARNPFLAFADIKTSRKDDAIVVDWDSDGDLDVILRTTTELLLFESKPGGKFVRVEPNPFKGIPSNPFSSFSIGDCMLAVVDWDRDGELDLIIGAKDGIEFYHRGFDRELHQRTGADNPFQHIRTKKGGPCSDLSVADWDGDGDLDLLVSDLHLPMRYFEQVDGRLVSVDEDRNPFHHILQNSVHRRPFMVDWNGDGRLELLLMPNILERLGHAQGFFADELCSVELYERDYSQDPEILRQSLDPLLLNRGCSNFTGSGVSLADLDGDGDLDAVFGADGAPLHVFEHTPSGWRSAGPTGIDSDSIPLDAIPLDSADPSNPSFRKNLLRPVLADWDLDGDLDLALLHDNGLRGGNRYFEHQSDGTVREINDTHLSKLNANCSMNWRVGFSFVDFDGDGAKDLVGFDQNFNVIICVRTSSGFEMVSAERDPFYWGPRQNASCFLKYSDRCPWDNDYPFGWFGIMGFPSFLDWDGDGDVDMLRINAANQVYLYEQLPNYTFFPQPLAVPNARDYVAADFDGDGDIDVMISLHKSNQRLYFERRSDGTLDQLYDTDNPFNAIGQTTHDDSYVGETNAQRAPIQWARSTLGDWNGDGDVDLVVVDESKVSLWINQRMEAFAEVSGSENPFGQLGFPMETVVGVVNTTSGQKLDLVVPHFYEVPGPAVKNGSYGYFQQQMSGELLEQHGAKNPFDGLEFADWRLAYRAVVKSLVVDFDGDGDLDIISGELAYRRNDAGHFKVVLPEDPAYPFRGIFDNKHSQWTFVDWDHDGDLDFVQAFMPLQTIELRRWALGEILEMKRNGTSQAEINAWMQKVMGAELRFYRQDGDGRTNISWTELAGTANPFHHIGGLGVDFACPAVVDLDGDGDWELVVATKDGLRYFEQMEGAFQKAVSNPFADVTPHMTDGALCPVPIFVDWDSDGSIDLVLTGTDKVQYFQRRVCMPSLPFCQQGKCNEQTSTCECFPGAEGRDCTLCGDFHVRAEGLCRKCPGWDSPAGTCSRRGMCDDDADARSKRLASNVSKATPATGSGNCTCSEPFYGETCEHGLCPPGQRLDRDAQVDMRSEKYPKWEACVPCQSGKVKNHSGIEECSTCPGGYIPVNGTSCVACEAGTTPSPDHNNEICMPCPIGSVAGSGNASCTPCEAGEAPSEDRSLCILCASGSVARPRSGECRACGAGFVPNQWKSDCQPCTGQMYALPGDDFCQACTFPSMILGEDNWCTQLYTWLFLLAFFLLVFLVLAVFGRMRLHCLKRRLKKITAAKDWEELHATQATSLEYGLWKRRASRELSDRKHEVKSQSFQLGISLQFVFEQLEDVYKETAGKAEWRLDEWGPVTKSGYLVKVRNCGIQLDDPIGAWNALPICDYPKDPNFHQVAGVLAYGPWALGKHMCCPRDGQPDCSIVDALQAQSKSAKATWFLSWVWGYKFSTVYKALARWWERHRIVSGAGLEDGIYMWWCVFVNNQFRMLEAGQVEEPDDLFDVFGQQLQGIGKMLMCLDKMRGGQYTTRIWCIFEVFVACQRSIPTTVILPELEVGAIASLEELTHECRVDAEQAKASVQADADAIKDHIKQKHQSFEYVNRTVEHALWCEVIEFLESSKRGGAGRPSQLGPGSTSTGPPTSGPAESTMSESMATDMAAEHGKCNLQ